MDRYVFPAIIEPGDKKGYCISFPDLPGCITESNNIDEAIRMAKDALELHIYGMEDDGDSIPEPTAPDKLIIPAGAFISLIEVWMPVIREEMQNKAVKKTLTIPKWLNDAAEKEKINFSQVLQTALKDYLGILKKVKSTIVDK
jgi:predicted RNase H-like HicB family nuclease